MCSDGPPPPDPNIGIAARENAEIAKAMLELGKDQLQWNKDRWEKVEPGLLESAQLQLDVGKQNKERADSQWQTYQDLFAPIEKQYAEEAKNYGSEADQAAQAEQARAGVASSFEQQRGVTDRELARSGVNINPASESSIARRVASGNEQAAAEAGAANTTRRNVRLQGMAMREGVAKFGRGMPSTGIAQDQLALSGAGMSAGTTNAATASYNAGNASAQPWYSGAIQGNTAAGNLYLGQSQQQLQGWQAQTAADSATFSGIGSMIGMAAMARSSKKVKENMRAVAGKGILAKIETLPVERWKYKKGVADEGEHIGPYAEDVHARFGDKAAPGGKMIDLISMNGIALAGVKALLDRVKNLEGAANESREAVAA